ncbi:hypothetical protein Q7C36_005720 [Tachysurus vachellii]|uniref:Uncharacterized protein n=1 Tax=Tachysurus vachellii TaxID=175792 RepID=A0AA88T0J8_TACVA|nr:hypothetical protein Q7C36_005720 [Tachysurus vachellii]
MQALERQKRPIPRLRREMESGMEVHFKDLTGIPLKETFLNSIDRKGNRLLNFMGNKEELLLHYVEQTSFAKDVQLENLPDVPAMLLFDSCSVWTVRL